MKKASLKGNLILSILSQVILYLIPLIVAPYLSRTIGAEGVGDYSYAFSICYYFNIFIVFGFNTYGNKEISKVRNDKLAVGRVIWNIFWTRIALFILSFSLYVYLNLSNLFPLEQQMMWAISPVLFASLIDFSFVMQGLEKVNVISFTTIIVSFIYLVCVLIFVKSVEDLVLYTFIKSLVSVVIAAVEIVFVTPVIGKPVFSFTHIKDITVQSFLFFLPNVITTIAPMIDQTMIGQISSSSEVAFYEQSHKIITMVNMLITAVSPVILSRVSYLFAEKEFDQCKDKIRKTMHLAYLIVVPCSIGLIVVAQLLMPVYLGEEFAPASSVLAVLAVGTLFAPINNVLINGFFYPAGKIKLVTLIVGGSVLVNMIANLVAIKYLGSVGAAITTVSISLLTFAFCVVFSWKFVDWKSIWLFLYKILISGIVMGIVVFLFLFFSEKFLANRIIRLVLSVFIGICVYGISIFAFKDDLCLFYAKHYVSLLKERFRK